ncbi:MAG TPA: WYL domain-containing protein [Paludibacter sp.]
MAKDLFNRYIWLVDTIYSRSEGLTFEEINERWERSSRSEGNPLPLRTFHNHRAAIEELFEIIIECNKSTYRYYIDNAEDLEKGGVRRWLLNTFVVNNLINESHKLKQRILFEEIPSGQHFLTPIIEAMRDGMMLEMTYQSYWSDKGHGFSFEPYFVKVFKQRWYVIGKSDNVRIYALDRIQKLETLSTKFNMPKDPDPEEYFYNCFGIIHDDDVSPEKIKLKITSGQANYLRALPLHHSQKEIETTEDYSIFTYYLKPTFDFRQEILSLGDDAEVLSPGNFREEIGKLILKMSGYY